MPDKTKPKPAKGPRNVEDIRPGDLVTITLTVAEASQQTDSVLLTLVDSQGNTFVTRHTPGDGLTEVERPDKPVTPFRGPNFAGGTTRGPV